MDTSDLPQSETESHAKASQVANVDTKKTDMQNIPETDKEIDIEKFYIYGIGAFINGSGLILLNIFAEYLRN